MATNYHFRRLPQTAKFARASLHGETDKLVAAGTTRQGLTPVYVGVEAKKSLELKLPFGRRGGRRDVLLFTQELSTLLNAGVPLDRALSITSELTERPVFRTVVQDVIRVLKGGKSLADSIATKPEYFSRCTSTWCAREKHQDHWRSSSSVSQNSSGAATISEAISCRRWCTRRCSQPSALIRHLPSDIRHPEVCTGVRGFAHGDSHAHQNHARSEPHRNDVRVARGRGADCRIHTVPQLHRYNGRTPLVGRATAKDAGARGSHCARLRWRDLPAP